MSDMKKRRLVTVVMKQGKEFITKVRAQAARCFSSSNRFACARAAPFSSALRTAPPHCRTAAPPHRRHCTQLHPEHEDVRSHEPWRITAADAEVIAAKRAAQEKQRAAEQAEAEDEDEEEDEEGARASRAACMPLLALTSRPPPAPQPCACTLCTAPPPTCCRCSPTTPRASTTACVTRARGWRSMCASMSWRTSAAATWWCVPPCCRHSVAWRMPALTRDALARAAAGRVDHRVGREGRHAQGGGAARWQQLRRMQRAAPYAPIACGACQDGSYPTELKWEELMKLFETRLSVRAPVTSPAHRCAEARAAALNALLCPPPSLRRCSTSSSRWARAT